MMYDDVLEAPNGYPTLPQSAAETLVVSCYAVRDPSIAVVVESAAT